MYPVSISLSHPHCQSLAAHSIASGSVSVIFLWVLEFLKFFVPLLINLIDLDFMSHKVIIIISQNAIAMVNSGCHVDHVAWN